MDSNYECGASYLQMFPNDFNPNEYDECLFLSQPRDPRDYPIDYDDFDLISLANGNEANENEINNIDADPQKVGEENPKVVKTENEKNNIMKPQNLLISKSNNDQNNNLNLSNAEENFIKEGEKSKDVSGSKHELIDKKRKNSKSEDEQVNDKKTSIDETFSRIKIGYGLYTTLNSLLDAEDVEGIIYILKEFVSKKMYVNITDDKGLVMLPFLRVIPELKEEYISVIKFYSNKIIETDYKNKLDESALKGRSVLTVLECLKKLVVKLGCWGTFDEHIKDDADKECKDLWKTLTNKFSDCSCVSVSKRLQDRIINTIYGKVQKPFLSKRQKKLVGLLEKRSSKKSKGENKPIIPKLESKGSISKGSINLDERFD